MRLPAGIPRHGVETFAKAERKAKSGQSVPLWL